MTVSEAALDLIRDQVRVMQTRLDSLERRASGTDQVLAVGLADLRAELRNLWASIAGVLEP